MDVIDFLNSHYHKNPGGTIKVWDALRLYRETHPGYPRWKFVAAVTAHYPVGKDSDRILVIGGLSTEPPATWAVDDSGRLRLQHV